MLGLSAKRMARWCIALFLCIGSFSSCLSPRKVIYFNQLKDSATSFRPYVIDSVTPFTSPLIQPNDILTITIQTIAQNDNNMPVQPTKGITDPLSGFLVDQNGNIEISLIGFIKVGGLTTAEARELIKNKAKEFYKDPVVNVRIANFDLYFLGEFPLHNTTIINEKADLLQAVAMGGDLPLSAKRRNVLLIRTEGDTRKFVRFDMTRADMFKSPYFYMRQRDVLYAEPSKFKVQSSDNTINRNVGIISALLSLLTVIIAFKNIK